MSDIYPTGEMDPFIRTALDRAEVVRDIYARVANVHHAAGWLPLSIVCPTCGKVGTTLATDWDGETVAFVCGPDYVTWATGCGSTGRVSPFGGAAKLPWNLEWAAQWSLFGVTIEPCGKDLSTAGGSRDRSDAIAREVYEREPPLNVAYEFLNIGGRKMSTSKGRGAAAHTIAEVVPPEQLRFLFLRPRPNQAIEFDPEEPTRSPGCSTSPTGSRQRPPAATSAASCRPGSRPRSATRSSIPPRTWTPRQPPSGRPFSHLALLLQVPGVDVSARVVAEKGSELTPRETGILARAHRRGSRVARHVRAGVRDRRGPAAVAGGRQRPRRRAAPAARAALVDDGGRAVTSGRPRYSRRREQLELPAGRAFDAIYRAFLGRTNGPRAGWLLASLDPDFVATRLREAAMEGATA